MFPVSSDLIVRVGGVEVVTVEVDGVESSRREGGFFVIPEVVDGIGRADVVTAETDVVGSSSVFWGGGGST